MSGVVVHVFHIGVGESGMSGSLVRPSSFAMTSVRGLPSRSSRLKAAAWAEAGEGLDRHNDCTATLNLVDLVGCGELRSIERTYVERERASASGRYTLRCTNWRMRNSGEARCWAYTSVHAMALR